MESTSLGFKKRYGIGLYRLIEGLKLRREVVFRLNGNVLDDYQPELQPKIYSSPMTILSIRHPTVTPRLIIPGIIDEAGEFVDSSLISTTA